MFSEIVELPFLAQITPAFVHPLLQNIEKIDFLDVDKDELKSTTSKIQNIETIKFFDPLGAFVANDPTYEITKLEKNIKTNCSKETVRKKTTQKDLYVNKTLIGIDELAGQVLENTLDEVDNEEENLDLDFSAPGFMPWNKIKKEILIKFNTTDKLNLDSSFLNYSNIGNTIKQEKTKDRKRSTEFLNVNYKFSDLTSKEYIKKLMDLKKLLIEKWKQEKRIDCIKLIIEVARCLSTVPIPQFYPTQFSYITDILDFFGNLVFERLFKKANDERLNQNLTLLSKNFLTHDILEQTRMTARNWFGKVNEIKETIPRIYVECALLKCMIFMDQSAIKPNLMRLCSLAMSVQLPLISAYVRCYICRIAMRLDSDDKEPMWKCLNDFMQSFTHSPTTILWPALQYIIQCLSYNAMTYEDLLPLWEYCKLSEKRPVILCPMLNGIPHIYLAENAIEACEIVTNFNYVTVDEICAFCENLLKSEIAEINRKKISKSIWNCIMRLDSVKSYLKCCDVWIKFIVKYFTITELKIVLENVLQKLSTNKNNETCSKYLLSILKKILNYNIDFMEILNLNVFMQFVDNFRDDQSKKDAAFIILETIILKKRNSVIKDLSLAYQVRDICKTLNDTITFLSPEDEINKYARFIQLGIDRFNLNDNPEQALLFYVACRNASLNNEAIQIYIIKKIMSLSLFVIRSIRFTTSKLSFLHACIANLFVTIPSISNLFNRLRLSIQSAQIALAAFAFLQVEELINFCLETFSNLMLIEHLYVLKNNLSYFLSFLLVLPQDSNNEPLKNFGKLFLIITSYEWLNNQNIDKAEMLLNLMQYLLVNFQLTITPNIYKSYNYQLTQFNNFDNEVENSGFNNNLLTETNKYLVGIAQMLTKILNSSDFPTKNRLNICMELAEIIAEFADEEILPEPICDLTKEAYRFCKRSGDIMYKRIKLLK